MWTDSKDGFSWSVILLKTLLSSLEGLWLNSFPLNISLLSTCSILNQIYSLPGAAGEITPEDAIQRQQWNIDRKWVQPQTIANMPRQQYVVFIDSLHYRFNQTTELSKIHDLVFKKECIFTFVTYISPYIKILK